MQHVAQFFTRHFTDSHASLAPSMPRLRTTGMVWSVLAEGVGCMPEINAGDTAWVLASSALVMLMTPALGFFYGGLVRRKNVLATIMHSFFILALISVQWMLWGYSLAFGPDKGGVIGGLDWIGLRHVGSEINADYATTIPHSAF